MTWLMVAVACLIMAGGAEADIINGGFETGDLTGWTVRIPMGLDMYNPDPSKPYPGGVAEVLESFSGYSSGANLAKTLYPEKDQFFTRLATGNEPQLVSLEGQYYVTSLRQDIYLTKGESLTGRAAFYNRDFVPQDEAWVKIYKNGVEISNPWYAISGGYGVPSNRGDVSLNGELSHVQYLDFWPWAGYIQGSPPPGQAMFFQNYKGDTEDLRIWRLTNPTWATWSWDAPDTGTYTIELAAVSRGDDEFSTSAFFDGIRVPEPTAIVLLGLGFIFVAALRRENRWGRP